MKVRLFHKHARLVIRGAAGTGEQVWYALHRRPVDWPAVLAPSLALLAFKVEADGDALRFGSGTLRWTRGPFWTTIRLQLPPCSPKKAALLAAGLLKAARYAGGSQPPRNNHAKRD